MTTRIPVYVQATDPVSRAGLEGQLRFQPNLKLVATDQIDETTVGVVAAEAADNTATDLLHRMNRQGCQRIILVVSAISDNGLLSAIEAGVCGLIRRHECTAERLAQLAVKAAAGEAALPSDVLARLLGQISQLQRTMLAPQGLQLTGLSDREVAVLRLVADGLDTDEIARDLSYSSRTVKNILHDVTSRFQLRNRSHAVAYALRQGLI